MPKKGYKQTEKHKVKLGKANLGRKRTKEVKERMSEIHKGHPGYWKGKRFSKKHREKISDAKLGKEWSKEQREKLSGRNSSHWQGGKSFKLYSVDWTKTLKTAIRERDCYVCQLCKAPQRDKIYDVHHIDYNKKNCNSDNLVTLCRKCHMKTNFDRDYWINFFKDLLSKG